MLAGLKGHLFLFLHIFRLDLSDPLLRREVGGVTATALDRSLLTISLICRRRLLRLLCWDVKGIASGRVSLFHFLASLRSISVLVPLVELGRDLTATATLQWQMRWLRIALIRVFATTEAYLRPVKRILSTGRFDMRRAVPQLWFYLALRFVLWAFLLV